MLTENSSTPAALKRKITSVNSLLIMLQRTIDSPDCCVYTKEMSSVLNAALDQMSDCEELTSQLVVEHKAFS